MARIYEYKDSILEKIHKNRRRIFAYIKQNQIKRIKVYIILVIILFSSFKPILAIENDSIQYGDYNISCYKDPFMYITYKGNMQPNYEYYYESNGKQIPAYCLDYGLKGPDAFDGGYSVNATRKINDEKLQMIVLNGYPYKSVEELGLNNVHEAQFATQFAIWCYASGVDINQMKPISDLNVKLVSVIWDIYNSKDRDIHDKDIWLDVDISKQTIKKSNIDYYVRDVKVSYDNLEKCRAIIDNKFIQIKEIEDFTRIYVPVSLVQDEYFVDLYYEFTAKENSVLFGKTYIDGTQDMVVSLKNTFEDYVLKEIPFKSLVSSIKVYKIDEETKQPLEGVKFLAIDNNGDEIGTYITNTEGSFDFQIYNSDNTKIYLKEIETKEGYVLDDSIHEIDVDMNSNITLEFSNKKGTGTIEIMKRTKEYNPLSKLPENSPMKDVKFNIIDIEGNVVDSIITDEYGYAKTKSLVVGKYYIKEVETNDFYVINNDLIEVEILEDEDNINVHILNDNVEIEDKLPVTGR